jgi:hypothetical protein
MIFDLIELSQDQIEYIRLNPNIVDWEYISYHALLSENFILKFEKYVFWQWISYRQFLSVYMIKRFIHKINLYEYFSGHSVSEDLIKKLMRYYSQSHWDMISYNQKLSKEFIAEFVDKIDFNNIINNKNISQDVKDYCRMFI